MPVVADKKGHLYYAGKKYTTITACEEAGAKEAWCLAARIRAVGGVKSRGSKSGGKVERVSKEKWAKMSEAEQKKLVAALKKQGK